MNNKVLVIIILVVVAVLSIPLIAQMGGGIDTPEKVVAKFLDATNTGDAEKIRPYVTPVAWEASAGDFKSHAGNVNAEYIVNEGTINGTESNVPTEVTQKGVIQFMNFLLRQVNEKWLVYGFEMRVQGIPVTMDFENPDQSMDDIMEEVKKMIPEAMRAGISDEMIRKKIEQEFEKVWSSSE